MRKRAETKTEEDLRTYRKEYEQIKTRIQKIGFICKGSINERWIPCGTARCGCHKDPKKRHGPYYQLSWKEKGKTRSHFIPPESVDLYTRWIQNRRLLIDLIDKMEAISRKVGKLIRATGKRKSNAPKKRMKGKKRAKRTR
jgi:hypothetical protein